MLRLDADYAEEWCSFFRAGSKDRIWRWANSSLIEQRPTPYGETICYMPFCVELDLTAEGLDRLFGDGLAIAGDGVGGTSVVRSIGNLFRGDHDKLLHEMPDLRTSGRTNLLGKETSSARGGLWPLRGPAAPNTLKGQCTLVLTACQLGLARFGAHPDSW
jgi:hypothetical protein